LRAKVRLRDMEERLRSFLGLKYRLVGVKIIKNSFGMKGSPGLEKPAAFCHMVREASRRGVSFLYGLDYERCPTAQTVLGFRSPRYRRMGWRVIPPGTSKVLISPLSEIRYMPDVVLAILTPREMMDLTVMLQAVKDAPLSAEFTGERACAEFFAKPFLEGRPNVSLLCHGARETYSDFRDDELIFGAPLEVYTQAADAVERISRMGGALCGCQTSDIPTEIINEFERINFSKGTDYFFGKVNGLNVRIYLNKDLKGRLNLITIHLPTKTPSEKVAEEMAERIGKSLPRMYFVNKRGYWLDLALRGSEDALGIDLFDGPSIRMAVERFIKRMAPYLSSAR